MADSTPPTRRPLRRVRALLRAFFQIDAELAFRATEEKDHREAQLDRRKWLVGHVVLERAITEPALIPELRSHLDTGLTRAYDRALFQIDAGRPLIPLAEWPDWPERDDTLAADDSYDRMPPRRLRARITSLANRKKEILKELEALLKEDEPQREKKNDQRKIVVGAVLFKRILGKHEETNRLRKLLDNGLSAQRDRELFQLDGDGPLVPKELWSALQVTPAPAAKKRDADAVPPTADAHARSTRSASKRPGRIGPAGSPQAGGAGRSAEPDSTRNGAMSPDVQEPITGWRPSRLPGASASDSEDGKRNTEWGAVLKGRAGVAALPTDLVGKKITVTDSDDNPWTTTITEVVRRDDESVTVRNSGRPGWEGKRSRGSKPNVPSST